MTTLEEPTVQIQARPMPGRPARLALPHVELRRGLGGELARGFFGGAATVPAEGIIAALEAAGLRGRGGAGFPAHIKWGAVAAATGPKVVVANGHEGEPASGKDAWLLTRRPYLVIDGLLLAARAVGAQRAIIYVSHDETIAAAEAAVTEVFAADLVPAGVTLEVFRATGGYVAGEESAVCRAISGGPALPTAKPPRPFEAGVEALPTLVTNVETLAHAAWIRRHGPAEFRATGTEASPGTALFTLTGACADGGIIEAPLGTRLGDLVDFAGGVPGGVRGLIMGGWFGGLLTGERGDLACSYEGVVEAGSGLGCAAITLLGSGDDLLEIAAGLGSWFEEQSARQCGVCRNGTRAIRDTLRKVADGDPNPDHTANLARWGAQLPRRGACAFLDGAATLARSVAGGLTTLPLLPTQCADNTDNTEGESR